MIWLNNLVAKLLPFMPKSLVGIVAKTYIAGETLDAAVGASQTLNRQGIGVTLDLLGESPADLADCDRAVAVYEEIIEAIHDKKLAAGISLKPSHMGLKLDPGVCAGNIRHLASRSAVRNIFLRIDMEEDALRQATMDLFFDLQQEFSNVGIVMQAYLRCAMADADGMIAQQANVRLCKGAYYWEDPSIVYKDPGIVNRSYAYLLEKYLRAGCFVGIATHDEALVFEALRIIDRFDIPKDQYEFQMLYGVTEELRSVLAAGGHPVRVYVPFGRDWFAYSVRRLKENPMMVGHVLANAGSILRDLLKRS